MCFSIKYIEVGIARSPSHSSMIQENHLGGGRKAIAIGPLQAIHFGALDDILCLLEHDEMPSSALIN